ncbi:DNA recombination protein RmuC [Thiospirochaeta perfilievii]|uniref:DNA recombination protein RmuC n=1 Tax=Thiospirochaeta perfilievii TaxID=252967 RepID=A0A5C1Q5J1_9SPIO|nr:DNA recombination protein RmuC [Thiospirochaeta perfilievii]QEN03305.1 DNA recombination protein RmuC [Thiospirochaeta perfilievii]
MTNILLGVLILVVIVNIILTIKRKVNIDIKPQLKELEDQILKFDILLEKSNKDIKEDFKTNRTEINEQAKNNREEQSTTLNSFKESQIITINSFKEEFKTNTKDLGELLEKNFTKFSMNQQDLNKNTTENIKEIKDLLQTRFTEFNKQNTDANKDSEIRLKEIKESIEKHLNHLREENTKQINEMRNTVDEKLQSTLEKRIGESFKQVSERLELVHKGLGEMQTIATGVGDLKKVLSNVKTRGILGEYQLGNILEEILSPQQYSHNVATKKGSQANVEYAVVLPGKSDEKEVWLPIDSKFPIENYERLVTAYDEGDTVGIELSRKNLIKSIESFAKDISTKYLDPPHTTDFAIMFLPVEGLFAEVLREPGIVETLQKKYKISVTGPTTLSALLSSLNMGFRTLAVQKKSSEVWKVLEEVKTEFVKFEDHLEKVHKQISSAANSIDHLKNTRTNAIIRKLKDVGTLEIEESTLNLEEVLS